MFLSLRLKSHHLVIIQEKKMYWNLTKRKFTQLEKNKKEKSLQEYLQLINTLRIDFVRDKY